MWCKNVMQSKNTSIELYKIILNTYLYGSLWVYKAVNSLTGNTGLASKHSFSKKYRQMKRSSSPRAELLLFVFFVLVPMG